MGAGVSAYIQSTRTIEFFAPRRVITSSHPIPGLGPLLWDAAGIVTGAGNPAAHLFESARSLGVPAVCGVALERLPGQIVAVDGYTGLVATLPMYQDGTS